MLRRRYSVTFAALAAIGATWALMIAFSWSTKLGVITLAPWVALIGLDAGVVAGTAAAALAATLWLVASNADDVPLSHSQIGVRVGSLVVLASGSALVGRRLRASEESQRAVASLQSALIDATLDGICLTDASGEILISNRPLRRLTLELGLPQHGTVPERLLAIADTMVAFDMNAPPISRREIGALSDARLAANSRFRSAPPLTNVVPLATPPESTWTVPPLMIEAVAPPPLVIS